MERVIKTHLVILGTLCIACGGAQRTSFEGTFYYGTTGGSCETLTVADGRATWPLLDSPCSNVISEIECFGPDCFLTCQNANGSDSSVVFYISEPTLTYRTLVSVKELAPPPAFSPTFVDSVREASPEANPFDEWLEASEGVLQVQLYSSLAACETAN